MADLNLRNVPDELMVELKKAAAEAGCTLKELCVHRLSGKTYGEIRRKAGPDPLKQIEAVREGEKARVAEIPKPTKMIISKPETPRIETRPGHAETCRCGVCSLRKGH